MAGKFRKILEEERKNMPSYQYNFLYKRVLPGFIFVLGGAIVVLVLGLVLEFTLDNKSIAYIPFIVWAVGVAVCLVLFVVSSRKLSARLINDKTDELQKQFVSCGLDEATAELNSVGVTADSIVADDGLCVELSQCLVYFDCMVISGKICLTLLFVSQTGTYLRALPMDVYSYTWFQHNSDLIVNKQLFQLFVDDKRAFLQLLYKYNNSEKMTKKLSK